MQMDLTKCILTEFAVLFAEPGSHKGCRETKNRLMALKYNGSYSILHVRLEGLECPQVHACMCLVILVSFAVFAVPQISA
jgi:hypothetical protein